jgi:tetratricopeptide (TPR) repeat protein
VILWSREMLSVLWERITGNRIVVSVRRKLSHWAFLGRRSFRAKTFTRWWGLYLSIPLLILATVYGVFTHQFWKLWPFYFLVVLVGLFIRFKDDFAKYGSVAIALVAFAYVIYQSEQPTTAIAPFTIRSGGKADNIPFSGETVANVVRDGLDSIGKVARQEPGRFPCPNTRPPSDIPRALASQDLALNADLLPVLRIPEPTTAIQSPEPVTLEVKGISLNALLSAARALQGTERLISGDVIVDATGSFSIVARSNKGDGAWNVGPYPANKEGLANASCKLAEYILKDTNPNLLAEAYVNSQRSAEVLILYNYQIHNYQLSSDAQGGHDAFMLEGAANMQLAKYQVAVNRFNEALSKVKNDPVALESIGLAYVGAGDYDSAFTYLNYALKCPPAFLPCPLRARNYYDRGVAFYYKKDYANSIGSFQHAIELKPEYAAANFYLGEAFQRSKQYQEAIKAYEAAMRSEPIHPFDVAIIQLQLGNAFDLNRQPEKAIEAYQNTVTYFGVSAVANPDDLELRYLSALMCLRIGTVQQQNNLTIQGKKDDGAGYYGAAIDLLNPVVSRQPENSEARTLLIRAHMLLGIALFASNQNPRAIAEMSEAIAQIDRSGKPPALSDELRLFLGLTLVTRSEIYLNDGRGDLAMADSRRAIEALSTIHPSSTQGKQMWEWMAKALTVKAEAEMNAHQYQIAINTLTRAIKLSSASPEATRDLGKAYMELGFFLLKSGTEVDEAEQDFTEAIRQLTSIRGKFNDVSTLLGRAYVGSSAALNLQHRYDEAKSACNEGLVTLEPDPKMKSLILDLQKQCSAIGNRH